MKNKITDIEDYYDDDYVPVKADTHMRHRQCIYGIAMILIGLLSILPECDVTFACLAVPIGIWLIATKNKVLY